MLMDRAIAFCRERGFKSVYLTTFEGLHAARALYERMGFQLTDENEKDPWSGTVGIQRFELDLGANGSSV
jgi:GNAT superfamily N-acetyltransferase